MRDRALEVRIVNGRVETPRGVPMAWLPLRREVIAKFPPRKGNTAWLHETVRIRSPVLSNDRWKLPRSCLNRLVIATLDRYGVIVLVRDMSKLTRCNRSCLEATGADCDCACLGAHHGEAGTENWFETFGDTLVADLGEKKRTAVVLLPRQDDSDPAIYAGELRGTPYSATHTGRKGWPAATQFMCACCVTRRAKVWDHCHAHGFVRAPLCTQCNTRHWSGWDPLYGRIAPSSNVDTSYYRWCPDHGNDWQPCSA